MNKLSTHLKNFTVKQLKAEILKVKRNFNTSKLNRAQVETVILLNPQYFSHLLNKKGDKKQRKKKSDKLDDLILNFTRPANKTNGIEKKYQQLVFDLFKKKQKKNKNNKLDDPILNFTRPTNKTNGIDKKYQQLAFDLFKKKQPKKNLSALWDEGKTKVETIKLTPEVLQQFYNQNQSSSPKPVKKQTRKIYPPSLTKTLYVKIMLDELNKKARSDIVLQEAPYLKTNIYKINKEYVIKDNVSNEQLMPKTNRRKTVEDFLNTLEYNTKFPKYVEI